jgi:hypothetical protein
MMIAIADMEYAGVPNDVAKLINLHAKKNQTPVSLQALMRTGRGEFLDKHFEDSTVEKHTATELVLLQVSFGRNVPWCTFDFLFHIFSPTSVNSML